MHAQHAQRRATRCLDPKLLRILMHCRRSLPPLGEAPVDGLARRGGAQLLGGHGREQIDVYEAVRMPDEGRNREAFRGTTQAPLRGNQRSP